MGNVANRWVLYQQFVDGGEEEEDDASIPAPWTDADKAGREAADTLCARALAARLQCEVLTPMTEGADWCDVWAARGAAEVTV